MKTLFFLMLYFVGCVYGLRSCSNEEKPLSDFCAKDQTYSKVQNPDFPKPTTVYIEVIIRDILNVDVENHLVEFVAYSNLHWTDSRIDIRSIKTYAGRQTARPTSEELNKLWTTDVHYAKSIMRKILNWLPKMSQSWSKLNVYLSTLKYLLETMAGLNQLEEKKNQLLLSNSSSPGQMKDKKRWLQAITFPLDFLLPSHWFPFWSNQKLFQEEWEC